MAEAQSMASGEVVAKTLLSEHADFVRPQPGRPFALAPAGAPVCPRALADRRARRSSPWLGEGSWRRPAGVGLAGPGAHRSCVCSFTGESAARRPLARRGQALGQQEPCTVRTVQTGEGRESAVLAAAVRQEHVEAEAELAREADGLERATL